jgi:hypothetical protein
MVTKYLCQNWHIDVIILFFLIILQTCSLIVAKYPEFEKNEHWTNNRVLIICYIVGDNYYKY